jgi:ABC-type nitrate/sulfonate/bicarbonate transport system ATPase subunit
MAAAIDNIKIELVKVSKIFGSEGKVKEVVALKDISFQIKDREIVSLIGPSGCGKSTLINIIAGFDTAAITGRVLLNGIPIEKPGRDRIVVFQSHALFPWLRVRENIGYGIKLAGVGKKDLDKKVQEFIESTGLSGFEDHFPYQLSGGMRQRVAIARALINQPSILLMDEPFGALDAQTRLNMQENLLDIWNIYQPTILLVTHDVEEAIFLSHRVLVMTPRPGEIKKEILVNLPEQRSYEIVTADEFVKCKKEAISILHGQ